MNQTNKTAYNLEERTAKFGEAVIGLCKRMLRMLLSCTAGHEEDIRKLQQECQELVLIFQKISSSTRLNDTLKIAH